MGRGETDKTSHAFSPQSSVIVLVSLRELGYNKVVQVLTTKYQLGEYPIKFAYFHALTAFLIFC